VLDPWIGELSGDTDINIYLAWGPVRLSLNIVLINSFILYVVLDSYIFIKVNVFLTFQYTFLSPLHIYISLSRFLHTTCFTS
jgi:hypothetical protein